MNSYFKFTEQTITDFSTENITRLYHDGYLFGRPHRGYMYQTRSLRIDLSKFDMTSENRRILRKSENISIAVEPLPYVRYAWQIGKLAKDFYDSKFGEGTFTANKIKEMMTDSEKSNFNAVLSYRITAPTNCIAFGNNPPLRMPSPVVLQEAPQSIALGYAICYVNDDILHYSYPFYQLENTSSLATLPPSLGMSMMTKAILWAKHSGKKYVYLGSATRPGDVYKLQFAGLEWFDGDGWTSDLEELKDTLKT